jgi:hypothetical protein
MSVERLVRALSGQQLLRRNVSDESPLMDDLRSRLLSFTDLWSVADSSALVRSRVRYIAAIFPTADLRSCAESIHSIIDNRSVTVGDVRIILDGRSLADPSRRTHEVPFERVQQVGLLLSRGMSRAKVARAAGVSVDTVEAIDEYIGFSDAIEQVRIEKAIDAVRDGMSIRKFAATVGVPVTTAHRLIIRARDILAELGEVGA